VLLFVSQIKQVKEEVFGCNRSKTPETAAGIKDPSELMEKYLNAIRKSDKKELQALSDTFVYQANKKRLATVKKITEAISSDFSFLDSFVLTDRKVLTAKDSIQKKDIQLVQKLAITKGVPFFDPGDYIGQLSFSKNDTTVNFAYFDIGSLPDNTFKVKGYFIINTEEYVKTLLNGFSVPTLKTTLENVYFYQVNSDSIPAYDAVAKTQTIFNFSINNLKPKEFVYVKINLNARPEPTTTSRYNYRVPFSFNNNNGGDLNRNQSESLFAGDAFETFTFDSGPMLTDEHGIFNARVDIKNAYYRMPDHLEFLKLKFARLSTYVIVYRKITKPS
jgi:hypothetical protein